MKISQESNERNLKQINEMQERWKEISKALAKPAPAPTNHSSGIYRTGDGETIQPVRPGSQDHKKWPSKGLLSDVPNNVGKT